MAISSTHYHKDGSEHYQAPTWHLQPDGSAVKHQDVCVFRFSVGDVEDPDMFAGLKIYEWQKTDCGRWAMEHAVGEPYWIRMMDPTSYGYSYNVMARLTESDNTFFELKFK